MKKLIVLLALLLSVPGWGAKKPGVPVVPAGAPLFRQAGSAYEAGKYAEALALYSRAGGKEGLTAALAYNRGNAEFRMGRRGLAIVWYERAREMSPRDGDILFNLRVARSHLQDEDGTIWETLDRVVTRRELPGLVAFLAWLAFGTAGMALWGLVSWRRVRWAAWTAVFLLVVAAAWMIARGRAASEAWSVVTVPVAEARSGPGDANPIGFTVPEGRRALVTGWRPGWAEIGVPSLGLKGWVREDAVERIGAPEAVK